MPLLGWIILAFIVAVVFAAIYGVLSAFRSIRSRYRAKRKLARDFAEAGIAPRAATSGKRIGMAVAATVTGPGVTWRALLDGVRRGWRIGKRWTAIQRAHRRRKRDAAAATSPPAGAPVPVGPDPAAATPPEPTPNTPLPTAAPAPTPSTTKGTTTVPIETKTGGEVHGKQQLVDELGAIVKEATDELEAANADLTSMQEDVARVDLLLASLSNAEIDTDTRRAVKELANTNTASRLAHQARINAAETRRAAAQNALDTFTGAKQTRFHADAS